jgi:1-deoxy-D-xylulose-5-phosphate reductoisomerase
MKEIILLGSTGSVGKNVLSVIRSFPGQFRVKAVSSYENLDLLIKQAEEFCPEIIILGREELYTRLKSEVPDKTRIIAGEKALLEVCSTEKADMVFMAIAGTAALSPLICSLDSGKTVALASKEPVVSAGFILRKYMDKGADIIPVDSEHSAVMECLNGRALKDICSLYLTGSGGSLKDIHIDRFNSLSVKDVLAHPKWDMGPKITVDSATFMNKGLEVIEARWLFDVRPEKIKVVVHPEAIIHSMVEFIDGTVIANMFCPDMRFPILRALSYPAMIRSDFERVNFTRLRTLSFEEPDNVKFPALGLAYQVLKDGGTYPAVLNASNEAAVNMFLEGKIKFTDIVNKVENVLGKHKKIEKPTLKQIINVEEWAKEEVWASC